MTEDNSLTQSAEEQIEEIQVCSILCINNACGHKFLHGDLSYSHIHLTCVKCGSKWSQKNNLPRHRITIKVSGNVVRTEYK